MYRVGIIGLGFVGNALYQNFKNHSSISLKLYDKYKNGGIGSIDEILDTDMCFLCLPTLYSKQLEDYDLSSIHDVCLSLSKNQYKGVVIIKSTVLPGTSDTLVRKYSNLVVVHNPEFLSAKTSVEDFANQSHIVLGLAGENMGEDIINAYQKIVSFYEELYPRVEISQCRANESESMKIFCNNFYALKIQIFNEFYSLCQHEDVDFKAVVSLMLKNQWINPMHTQVPGHDGQLSYGGACFPKDTQALLAMMKRKGTDHMILEACVEEKNKMRPEI